MNIRLTRRERDILTLMVQDLTNAEIAERLVMSLETVRWYVREIYGKLGVHSRDEAITAATEAAILKPPAPREESAAPVATPHNLPAPLTTFVGREREIADITVRLAQGEVRLLTLVGTGGIGKTRLSLEAAAVLLEAFPDGVYFVPLALLDDAGGIPDAIIQALDLQSDTQGDAQSNLVERIMNFLRARRILLVLDNFEHLLAGATLVSDLLAAAPRLKVLASSREPLRLNGEQEYAIAPLPLPAPVEESADAIGGSAAVRLFVQRASAVKADFTLTAENAPAIARICERIDGLPLAIELAAARIKLFTPQMLLNRISQRLDLLTTGTRDNAGRHQTLRAAIDWSYHLLDEEECRLFARLSVFVGGWSLEALEAICGSDFDASPFDLLASLIGKSLVQQVEGADGDPRFFMLETLREYAAEKLAEHGETLAASEAHAAYFAAFAKTSETALHQADQRRWMILMEQERGNLNTALHHLYQHDLEAAAQYALSLTAYWQTTRLDEYRYCFDLLLSQRDRLSTETLAKVLFRSGWMLEYSEDSPAAATNLTESIALFRQLDMPRWLGLALSELAATTSYSMESAAAVQPYIVESRALLDRYGSPQDKLVSMHNEGWIAELMGDYEGAYQIQQRRLDYARQQGDMRNVASSLHRIGWISNKAGNFADAEAKLEEALALSRDLNHRFGIARALAVLAQVMSAIDEWERSNAYWDEHEALMRMTGVIDTGYGAFRAIPKAHLGDFAGARAQLQVAIDGRRDMKSQAEIQIRGSQILNGILFAFLGSRQWREAAMMYGAADAYEIREFGAVLRAVPREELLEAKVEGDLKAYLTDEEYDDLYAKGDAMSLQEAIAFWQQHFPGK